MNGQFISWEAFGAITVARCFWLIEYNLDSQVFGDNIGLFISIPLSAMAALLKQYFNIAFLMGKPQDLPAGQSQLNVAIMISFVTYVLASLTHYSFGKSVGTAFVDLALSGVLIYVGLVAVGKTSRFYQSYGALCGAGAVLNIFALPLILARPDEPDTGSELTFAIELLLLAWSFSVLALILRHTFEIRLVFSVALAVCYFVLVVSLLNSIWPLEQSSEAAQVSNFQPLGNRWWQTV